MSLLNLPATVLCACHHRYPKIVAAMAAGLTESGLAAQNCRVANVLQRETLTGPVRLGEGWRLRKVVCGHARQAVCELWSHQLGWELRLVIDGGDLRRSQVVRSNDEILTMTEEWKSAMVGRGWQ